MVIDIFFKFLVISLWFCVGVVGFGGYWWFLVVLRVSCCFLLFLGGS